MLSKKINRIYILGTSGSGKTFLGKILSKKLKIPLYDSDDVMFIKKFTQIRTKKERKKFIDKISKKSKWIIDSRGSEWSRNPMKKSNLIIWLQPRFPLRTIRIIKRYNERKKIGRTEEDVKSLLKLLRYSITHKYHKNSSGFKNIKKFIEKNKLKPIIIKNKNQLNELLEELTKR